ncbi:MAG: DUF4835 family protein [Ignavibacteria bacterium]|jgi:hypothetical protein|nr:DUF4835 family protein [Ignavibacteria bacterium]MBK9403079.1 DUF4835 family protein [Ignavibacteria bacterium]MBL0107604.1 DUF4835 family protein [Ignavibacteria bacterium]
MQSQIKWFLIIVIISLTNVSNIFSQIDLKTEVTIDVTQLPQSSQEKLVNFKQKVEDYLNKNKYHNDKIPPIRVQMQFNFTAVNTTTLTYDAKLFIASQREVFNPFKNGNDKFSVAFRFLDERCQFVYNENIPFIKNDQRFDSFLSLLDYYAYMIVGYDEDSYIAFAGNKYFQKAVDICNKVTLSTSGWNETGGGSKPSRLQLVQELLNVRFDNFRKGYFEYMYFGLDSLTLKKKTAQNNMLIALEAISNIKKKEVKSFNIDIFFDSKATEIADVFLDYGDRSVYDKLINFDKAHQTIYDEARKKAR